MRAAIADSQLTGSNLISPGTRCGRKVTETGGPSTAGLGGLKAVLRGSFARRRQRSPKQATQTGISDVDAGSEGRAGYIANYV
jgi:hypothetical protein